MGVGMRAGSGAASVIVATDDARISSVAAAFGADVAMTSPQHASGTDRIAEVVRARGFAPRGDRGQPAGR
jgi:3-deoxy-manno-octulosonate cytidylyltransferase (CMP-KDO synthetase)